MDIYLRYILILKFQVSKIIIFCVTMIKKSDFVKNPVTLKMF